MWFWPFLGVVVNSADREANNGALLYEHTLHCRVMFRYTVHPEVE